MTLTPVFVFIPRNEKYFMSIKPILNESSRQHHCWGPESPDLGKNGKKKEKKNNEGE